jgi:hypothetical protein
MRKCFGLISGILLSLAVPAWGQAPTPLGRPPLGGPPQAGPAPEEAPQGREFCHQSVSFTVAPRETVPDAYGAFVGIFSDAAWTPELCAAIVVENVTGDGTATIIYADGPMGANGRGAGRVLNGTGIIRNGELKFQNSDGSQFSFKPFYSDLDGHLVTPKGQAYETIFKRSF